jgi:uncharacterized protein YdeI (YjbR/CyaY-like superfamily)
MGMVQTLATGVNHRLPADMRQVLLRTKGMPEVWNGLTPLARNEWICWVTYVKKAETRIDHLRRLTEDLGRGKRRPCCWPGCPHRRPEAAKWFSPRKK